MINSVIYIGPEVAVSLHGKILDSKIQLNCHVRSDSTPTIEWYKNNKLLKCKDPNLCEVHTSQNQGYYWSNMTKKYPKVNDNYVCVANNTDGISNDSFVIPCFEGNNC